MVPSLVNFRTEINRLFEDFFNEKPLPNGGNGGSFLPALDVRETNEAWILEAELPGIRPAEVEIEVSGRTLTLRGERKHEKEEKTRGDHRAERWYGKFERRIELPADADADRMEAAYRDGILEITIAKKAGAKPRTIPIKTATK